MGDPFEAIKTVLAMPADECMTLTALCAAGAAPWVTLAASGEVEGVCEKCRSVNCLLVRFGPEADDTPGTPVLFALAEEHLREGSARLKVVQILARVPPADSGEFGQRMVEEFLERRGEVFERMRTVARRNAERRKCMTN